MLRVLVVDESRTRAADICAGLALAGHQVAAILPSALDLAEHVGRLRPDVILIETDSPSRDTLEHLGVVNREAPRPVVIFASESDADVIRAAVRAGVSAYVVDGLDPQRIQPVIEVARARFEDYQALRRELADATQKLSERKLVEAGQGHPHEEPEHGRGRRLQGAAPPGHGPRQAARRRCARRGRHGAAAALNPSTGGLPFPQAVQRFLILHRSSANRNHPAA